MSISSDLDKIYRQSMEEFGHDIDTDVLNTFEGSGPMSSYCILGNAKLYSARFRVAESKLHL